MQNKQKAPFAGGDRVRYKMTSSGPQYKQSWLPAEAGSIQPSGFSLRLSLTWEIHLEDERFTAVIF